MNAGKKSDFEDLMREMVMATRDETGCQTYDWYISDDGAVVHILERYTDPDALKQHMAEFGANFADRFFACVTPLNFTIYGTVDNEIRGMMAPFGASFLGSFGGFRR